MDSERGADSSGTHWATTLMGGVVAAVFLLFLPLGISFVEWRLFYTSHFEDALRKLGLHDVLSTVYAPVVQLIRKVLDRP